VGYDAIVLAGGESRRLDGADKPALVVGRSTMLERVIAACSGAERVVVAGPRRPGVSGVLWCQESPAGGGPVAAMAVAVPFVQSRIVVTLAADLPFVAPAVPVLLAELGDADVAVLVDVTGRRNLLAAAWRAAALRARLAEVDPLGSAVRTLFGSAHVVEVADEAGWGRDCDTWPDVAAARAAADAAPNRAAAATRAAQERMP
jgi:molybdopterin-guanine dinucleotide biosynthesis protein A